MSGVRKEIIIDGVTWRLLYDPNDTTSVLPDVSTRCKVERVSQEKVFLNGAEQYMVIVDLLYPSVSTPSVRRPAQRVRGFRLSKKPIDPMTTPPETMIMYVSEVQSTGDSAQHFLDAVTQAQQISTVTPDDIAWTAELSTPQSMPEKRGEVVHE